MAEGLAEECAMLLGQGEAPVSQPGRQLPWRRVTAASVAGLACLLAVSVLLLHGPAATGGLATRLANEVVVLATAGNSSGGNKSGGNGSGGNKSGGNGSRGNGSGGNNSGGNGSGGNNSGGNGSGGNKSGLNGSGGNKPGGNGFGGNKPGGNGSGTNNSGGKGSGGNSSANSSARSSTNATAPCSEDHKGCLTSKCCKSPNFSCYKKNDQWAQCRIACTPGIDPRDPAQHATPWSCDDWDNDRKCAGPWGACINTKCCRDKKQRCFKKNGQFAQCRDSCAPGIDPRDQGKGQNATPWSCEKFDNTPAPPKEQCSADLSANCFHTRCCKNATSTCFKKEQGWAACGRNCTKGYNPLDPPQHRRKWSCELM